jgi:hypothetical protein
MSYDRNFIAKGLRADSNVLSTVRRLVEVRLLLPVQDISES